MFNSFDVVESVVRIGFWVWVLGFDLGLGFGFAISNLQCLGDKQRLCLNICETKRIEYLEKVTFAVA